VDELQASQSERLLRSGARFAPRAVVLTAAADDATKIAVRRIGPALVFERLWEETDCRDVIADPAGERSHKFAVERAMFLAVLHRLFVSGSDRAADRGREDYAITGVEALDLHHLYRAMAWLREELPANDQDGRTPFASLRDVIEERLINASARPVHSPRPCVLGYDQRASAERRSVSEGHRPDLRQTILAMLIERDGHPVCSEMWPGNSADVTTLIPVIERLRRRFDIARVCVVADRGMITAQTVAELEARQLPYILGASDSLTETEVEQESERFIIRATPRPAASLAIRAVGVANTCPKNVERD
jgi:hypothetical protein